MPLSSGQDYGRFLAAQYAARHEVERALCCQPPAGLGAPPSQTDVLASDLRDLDIVPVSYKGTFALEDPFAALGAAWVLAGSSLGNRSMLAQRRKAGRQGPVRFLSDKSLARYFGSLLGILDRPYSDEQGEQVISGALSTFAVFERAFAAGRAETAA